MHVGLAADHGGFTLKQQMLARLRDAGHEVTDFGAAEFDEHDDYPDFAVPLARAISARQVERGIAICGSGVGVCIVMNKVSGVRAALAHDAFSARQGVEDDDMNALCLGARVVGSELAWLLIETFLAAQFSAQPRHLRRLEAILQLEQSPRTSMK